MVGILGAVIGDDVAQDFGNLQLLPGSLWLLICLVLFGVTSFYLILLHIELVLVVVKGDFDLAKALFAVIVVVVAGSG